MLLGTDRAFCVNVRSLWNESLYCFPIVSLLFHVAASSWGTSIPLLLATVLMWCFVPIMSDNDCECTVDMCKLCSRHTYLNLPPSPHI